jgi:PE-PPE domain
VNGYKLLANAIAVVIIVGMAGAPISAVAHADVTLLSTDDPLEGSDTAIILGGTTEPTPSTAFADAVEDLYLQPLGFDDGATNSTVCDMVGTEPCNAPLQVLTTPELIEQGPSTQIAADEIVAAVENEFNANPPGTFSAEHPLTIFGYSQSATAESMAMTQLEKAGIQPDDLHFVFIGDPSLPGGIWPNLEPDMDALFGSSLTNTILTDSGLDGVLGSVTPDDLYPTTIYTLDGDGVADFQQDFTAGGFLDSILGLFVQHVEYLGLTPTEIADATTSTDGDITYVDISDNINNVDAWIGAIDHGVASSGLLESLFDSLQLYVSDMF